TVEPPAPLTYLAGLTFFPAVISGPIAYLREVFPQITARPSPEARREDWQVGSGQFAIGLFKKTVLADSFALWVDPLFAAVHAGHYPSTAQGWMMVLGYLFTMYFDFSGYSDMALGSARMLGHHGLVAALAHEPVPLRQGLCVPVAGAAADPDGDDAPLWALWRDFVGRAGAHGHGHVRDRRMAWGALDLYRVWRLACLLHGDGGIVALLHGAAAQGRGTARARGDRPWADDGLRAGRAGAVSSR
ncbi:hypothetical protein E4T56_gene9077, partial [Termitomyces sp. T112]